MTNLTCRQFSEGPEYGKPTVFHGSVVLCSRSQSCSATRREYFVPVISSVIVEIIGAKAISECPIVANIFIVYRYGLVVSIKSKFWCLR